MNRLLLNVLDRFRYFVSAATCQSGYGAVCKTVYPGSIPGVASNKINDLRGDHKGAEDLRQRFVSERRLLRLGLLNGFCATEIAGIVAFTLADTEKFRPTAGQPPQRRSARNPAGG